MGLDQGAILDHQFRVAAYAISWCIQLGYVAWLGYRWRAQKRDLERLNRIDHVDPIDRAGQ